MYFSKANHSQQACTTYKLVYDNIRSRDGDLWRKKGGTKLRRKQKVYCSSCPSLYLRPKLVRTQEGARPTINIVYISRYMIRTWNERKRHLFSANVEQDILNIHYRRTKTIHPLTKNLCPSDASFERRAIKAMRNNSLSMPLGVYGRVPHTLHCVQEKINGFLVVFFFFFSWLSC